MFQRYLLIVYHALLVTALVHADISHIFLLSLIFRVIGNVKMTYCIP